jgi:hypothetical protein
MASSDAKGWIVVFDLDDTLFKYNNENPEPLDDTMVLLQKAVQARGTTVQYIYLYTYNTNMDYIQRTIRIMENMLGVTNIFNDIIYVEMEYYGRDIPYPSKSVRRIQDFYDDQNEHQDYYTFKNRILFLDDLKHEVLFSEIGADHYAFLRKPGDIRRDGEIEKISALLTQRGGNYATSRSVKRYRARRSKTKTKLISVKRHTRKGSTKK